MLLSLFSMLLHTGGSTSSPAIYIKSHVKDKYIQQQYKIVTGFAKRSYMHNYIILFVGVLYCFQLHTSQNVATSMPSLTSQSCNDSLPAVCLARQVGAIYRSPEHLWMPDRPVNEASVKTDH